MKILLILPPLTQINTSYPATTVLCGFLNKYDDIDCSQADLSIELIHSIFSKKGLSEIFNCISEKEIELSSNSQRIFSLKNIYLDTIESIISFLQDKDATLAYRICQEGFLPQAYRFEQLTDMEWAFGTMGIHDKARYLATLYLEDLGDLIKEAIDPNFGFSRYAEQVGMSAETFDEIEKTINKKTLIDTFLEEILEKKIQKNNPKLVGLSVPFPGNLCSAFKIAKYLKKNYPHIKIILGGGYVNTELRELSDTKPFDYVDFITLDDGEIPILQVVKYIKKEINQDELLRCFLKENNKIKYINSDIKEVSFNEIPAPDYNGLNLDKYLSVIEIANPMHRLWSDGKWNKLTLAHGCYWHKCSFCDTSLDYISRYEPASATVLVDKIINVINQTGQRNFHFTDEAAAPKLLKDLAIELIKRRVNISWWTNVRFEKNFSPDLCNLIANSGCIAVSGGLEVASDRLLELMQKGISVKQVAQVTRNFTDSGIMVHAYLMYGFPTQTAQETIDSMEMVRQLFENGLIQSAFWHRFTMTEHSPVGKNPEKYCVKRINKTKGIFANNNLEHIDIKGCKHENFGQGLSLSIYNYMQALGFEYPLNSWFDFKIPRTKVKNNFIENAIQEPYIEKDINKKKLLYLGTKPLIEKNKKGKIKLVIHSKNNIFSISTDEKTAVFFSEILETNFSCNVEEFAKKYHIATQMPEENLFYDKVWKKLKGEILLVI